VTLWEKITSRPFWFIALIYLILVLCASELPVFWDMYGQVKTADFFLASDFTRLLPDGGDYSDNGHMPLYPLYLAALFRIFGFKLWVAHLSVLPFLAGALWQLYRLSLRYLGRQRAALVLLLTFFSPPFVSQALHFSQELALVCCSLWLINALLETRCSHIAMASVLVCLLNLRGISLCGLLLIYFIAIRKDRNALYIICGVLAWFGWLFWHYLYAGWWFSGEQIHDFRQLADLPRLLKNLALGAWKLCDLGAFFGWIIAIVMALRSKRMNEPLQLLLLAALAALIVCVPFTNPISNRYFLLPYILLLPAFVAAVSASTRRMQAIAVTSFALVLLLFNAVVYPDRYGNPWDCTLKSLAYFGLREELDAEVAKAGIAPGEMSAGFQLYFNERYYKMNGLDREYALLSDTEMPLTPYVAESNICNNFNAERQRYLAGHYTMVRSLSCNGVYIHVYKKKFTSGAETPGRASEERVVQQVPRK
jgi:hypothetical protein